jgi:hypothetical protein
MNENLLQSFRLRLETRSGFPHLASLRKPENLPAAARKRTLLPGSKREYRCSTPEFLPLIKLATAMSSRYSLKNDDGDSFASNP